MSDKLPRMDYRQHRRARRLVQDVYKRQPKHRLTGQTPSVWKIFSAHRERHLSKADGNTVGKNMTA